jgi:hypothetical protein
MTLVLNIGDETFDLWDAVQGATLGDLEDLQTWSKKDGFAGVTVETIDGLMNHIDDVTKQVLSGGGEDAGRKIGLAMVSDSLYLRCVPGVIWLCWRRAGRDVSYADARNVPAMNIWFDVEDDDDDPKALPSEGGSEPPE